MQHEIEMTIRIYVDSNSQIVRTGLMKYYFPLLGNHLETSLMSELFAIDHTLPDPYNETIPEDVANASQSTFVI